MLAKHPVISVSARSDEYASTAALPAPPTPLPGDRSWALFLDLDGTVCAYRDDPAQVALDPAQHSLLTRLSALLDGALCVLSGRSSADLERILGALPLQRIGEHGSRADELRDNAFQAQLVAAEMALHKLSAEEPGTWVERKPSSCALHYRQARDRAECLRAALLPLSATLHQMRLLDGHLVFEFTTRFSDKGSALWRQMQQAPFAGRIPVAVGDDVTDEDMFTAAAALGGFAVAVGPRVSAAAAFQLADARAVDRWLQQLVEGESHALA